VAAGTGTIWFDFGERALPGRHSIVPIFLAPLENEHPQIKRAGHPECRRGKPVEHMETAETREDRTAEIESEFGAGL
jgi:hypothetical protein